MPFLLSLGLGSVASLLLNGGMTRLLYFEIAHFTFIEALLMLNSSAIVKPR